MTAQCCCTEQHSEYQTWQTLQFCTQQHSITLDTESKLLFDSIAAPSVDESTVLHYNQCKGSITATSVNDSSLSKYCSTESIAALPV